MHNFIESKIGKINVHKVGNKLNDENIYSSKSNIEIDENINTLLMNYFLLPFKSSEYFTFYHDIDINMNEVFVCAGKIFDNPEILLDQSVNLAKHLYEQSTHPKIKGGEFYTVYFKDCIIDGETVDAVGLFKSENKDTFLKVYPSGEGFEIESEKGININKLDKGCLIFNTVRENGYIVAVVDNTNKGTDAQYWIDDFLHVRQRHDGYYNTQQTMSLCKSFIKEELSQQSKNSKVDQAALLNKSGQFFKENDNFNLDEFASEVMEQPEVIERFNQYKSVWQQKYEIDIPDNFTISDSAVKKQARIFKSVIKLDKNFHIYVHGNSDLIQQGTDENGKFYKIYYQEEN
ncbi:MAG: nucleoid-associated protein [Bacteroidales bacterium]|jgi:hypothetical protein|nr:nucleoid-associated protein [Bacteroidales bacterium]